ncbi:superoxide dismutase family protein [Polaribacter aestuariivivens]|uniref:Superoxide dismutase family protein n=1 Tax=Polaribacter aestuariivivens TaxID=2304626 RepID=A0A5S3NA60_9FLAO|nr:superoxide dismutase family protein [Polaribacter aestuariivivens]TMM31997.1 superoxide dismutase family protein [Polaribacter aestuariivivens]
MKILKKISLLVFAITTLSSCDSDTKIAKATIEAKSGSNVSGTVTFTEVNGTVTMKAELSGLSEGNHAIHIHAIGDCSAPDGTSAGGHWNPTDKNHGKWMQEPFHIGDIGNLVVGADGKGTIERETDLWSVGGEDANKNVVGHAIIIHEGPDDFSSQPSGAAGPRIGCGEIIRK